MEKRNKKINNSFPVLANALYHLYAIKILRNLIIKIVAKIEGGQFCSVTLRRIASAYHNVNVGMYSYGSCFSFDRMPPGTKIGRYCSLAEGVVFIIGNHPIERKSTHPFFYNPAYHYVDECLIQKSTIEVGNDVWIGYNAIILPSVKRIGDGAVIGAGSIVTKEVPPFAVVVGNPAKIIKYRFSNDKIAEIIKSAWWDQDIHDIPKEDFIKFLVSFQ